MQRATANSIGPAIDALIKDVLQDQHTSWPGGSTEAFQARFLEVTLDHGIQPLIYEKVRETAAANLWPDAVIKALGSEALRQRVYHVLLRNEAGRVLQRLGAAGIDALLLKGVPLAHTLYSKPELRPVSDVDLMIKRGDLEAISRALSERGYARANAVTGELVSQQAAFTRRHNCDVVFTIDVHWKISNRLRFADTLSFEEMAKCAVPVPALGPYARGLSPVHVLYMACVHRVAHHYDLNRLIWLYDIHLLAEEIGRESFEEFITLARERQMIEICADGLALAKNWFGTSFSEDLTQSFSSSAGWRFHPLLSDLKHLSTRRKLKLVKELLFPPADYMKRRYRVKSPLALPLLYLYRSAAGALKYIRFYRIPTK